LPFRSRPYASSKSLLLLCTNKAPGRTGETWECSCRKHRIALSTAPSLSFDNKRLATRQLFCSSKEVSKRFTTRIMASFESHDTFKPGTNDTQSFRGVKSRLHAPNEYVNKRQKASLVSDRVDVIGFGSVTRERTGYSLYGIENDAIDDQRLSGCSFAKTRGLY
jgi:hypothetical protein